MRFLGLACLAAVNPKLLAVDLILMGNRRPRLVFACCLLGGMGLALTVGLLDVFAVHADAIHSQGSASARLDVALGIPLLAVGVLLATGHLHRKQRSHAPAADRPSPNNAGWAERILHEPRFGLAIVVGALVGTPGVAYIGALHLLVVDPLAVRAAPRAYSQRDTQRGVVRGARSNSCARGRIRHMADASPRRVADDGCDVVSTGLAAAGRRT